jgi:hypothetical protein
VAAQSSTDTLIAAPVGKDLSAPKHRILPWLSETLWTPVPKTAIDKYRHPSLAEIEVWVAHNVSRVQRPTSNTRES